MPSQHEVAHHEDNGSGAIVAGNFDEGFRSAPASAISSAIAPEEIPPFREGRDEAVATTSPVSVSPYDDAILVAIHRRYPPLGDIPVGCFPGGPRIAGNVVASAPLGLNDNGDPIEVSRL